MTKQEKARRQAELGEMIDSHAPRITEEDMRESRRRVDEVYKKAKEQK